MNMSERIAFALAHSGRSPRDLSKEIGVSVARISQLKSGTGGIKAENLFALARATRCSPQWLAEGVGNPAAGDKLKPSYVLISSYGSTTSDRAESPIAFDLAWLTRLELNERPLKYISYSSGTMEPAVNDGDVLLLDVGQSTPESGGIFVVVRTDGQLVVKRLVQTMTNGWLIRSDNENKRHYPDEIVSEADIGSIQIAGRVVWRGGRI